jgi:hypothetical protein
MAIPDHTRWRRHHVDAWWNLQHRDLDYINEPFNDPVSQADWQRLGYTQTKFTGDMYDMRRPEPAWLAPFRTAFPWRYFSWSLYRMSPGTVLPEHRDTYARFRQLHDISDENSIYRAVIFMEYWQSGHYLEIDQQPITQWRPGDAVLWQNDVPHLAANMGRTDRYTLQITGVCHENPFI